MAVVAAEPDAATVLTASTEKEERPPDLEPLMASAEPEGPPAELFCPRTEEEADGEARQIRPELEPAAGKSLPESETPQDRMGLDRFSPGLPVDPESGGTCPQPYAVFLHSFPEPAAVTEAGLSLAEPAEPTTNVTTDRAETAGRERVYTSPIQPQEEPGLRPGSEVRVVLDHVIDDALVVSFRRGDQVFSGVLMDISKRFGPYGIPITLYPRRNDRPECPSSQQLVDSENASSIKKEEEEMTATTLSPPSQYAASWASKQPPLFQEGAPYPPPILIRDTYNQALPQPPPRKIKRLRRRYRDEEPTSIMNAIKLRPRQVLCDKCKVVVSTGPFREARRGTSDMKSEEASRRRRAPEGPIATELKRLRNDDKPPRSAADRRSSPGIRVSSTAPPRAALKGVASSSSPSGRVRINSRKVSDKSSNLERPKPRQVRNKLTQTLQPPQDGSKAVTRAAALQNHNQKVHFTRGLQRLNTAAVSGHKGLPARIRLKPQRYRTDEAPSPSSSSSSATKHSARLAPPTPAPIPAPTSVTAPPTSALCIAMQTETACTPEEEGAEQRGAPSSASSSSDSSHSECSSTKTFGPIHTEEVAPPCSSLPVPVPASCSSSLPPPSSSIPPPSTISASLKISGDTEEDGGELKRRRKSSTSSSSSSSSSSSVFSKSVSKVPLPDGRTVCVGDIVWAKIYGFPWWPARVLGITVARRGDTGLAVRQEARVSWFGSPTTSYLPLPQLSPFLETFQLRFDRKRKGPYRRAISEAASAAKQLTPEVRALLTQFET